MKLTTCTTCTIFIVIGIFIWTVCSNIQYMKNHTSQKKKYSKYNLKNLPGCTLLKNPPANAGDAGSIPSLGRSLMFQAVKAHAPQLLSLRA